MKKIISIVGVMVALVLSLTGCVKMDLDVHVASPEKAEREHHCCRGEEIARWRNP